MKILTSVTAVLLLSSPAFSQSANIGGAFSVYTGNTSISDTTDSNYDSLSFSMTGLEATIGAAASGGFGWQLDAHLETASADGAGFYANSGATLHGSYDLGGAVIGGFIGGGSSEAIYNGDLAAVSWYGVEAAKNFGDFVLVGQLGVSSAVSSTHGPWLDYSDYAFGAVEGRYFISDNIMVSGKIGQTTGNVHGDTLYAMNYELEVTMQLGQSNFYGNFGVRGSEITSSFDNEGHGSEASVFAGVSFLFGGGGLRDVYSGPALMLNNSAQSYMGTLVSTYD